MSQSVLNTESENFKLQDSAVGDKPEKPSVQNQVVLEHFTLYDKQWYWYIVPVCYFMGSEMRYCGVHWFHLLPWFVDEEVQDLLTETLDVSESRHEEKPPLQHPVKETSSKSTLQQASGSSAKRNKRCDWKYSTCSYNVFDKH